MNVERKKKMQRIKRRIFVTIILLSICLLLTWRYFENDMRDESIPVSVQEASEDNSTEECLDNDGGYNSVEEFVYNKISDFASKHQFSISDYPEELLDLFRRNAETEEFVLNYPLKKDTFSTKKLEEGEQGEIPLLLQWDSRWGYYQYGDNVMGLTGCGPTCLSMVASYLLRNPELTPIYMANYAMENKYYVSSVGTSWEFMSEGATHLGLRVQEIPLIKNKIYNFLQKGCPIICNMGPGEFTEKGHFIVLSGLEDDRIKINDPNSREHSNRLWEFHELKSQIRNVWVFQTHSE